jgi:hypothetical protein
MSSYNMLALGDLGVAGTQFLHNGDLGVTLHDLGVDLSYEAFL